MFQEGDFFLTLIPGPEGMSFYIQPNRVYEIISEDELEIPFQTKGSKRLTSFSIELLPKFLFFIGIDGQKKNRNHSSILKYPPLPNYKRKENRISLSPREYAFERNSILLIKTQGDEVKQKIQTTRMSVVDIDHEIYSKFLRGEPGSILIMQEGFNYILEEINQTKYKVLEPVNISQLHQAFYLSLKDILDAENGLERLTQDIKENKYIGENSQKLNKILNILRVAKGEEEHRIVTSLFLYDHDLFLFIYKELFKDSLIPYMSRKELSRVISQIDDHDLSEILDYPSKKKRLYSNLISKNRMAYLKKTGEKTGEMRKIDWEETREIASFSIWNRIEDIYRQEKQRLISLPGKEHEIYKIEETKSISFKKEFTLGKFVLKSSGITYLDFKKNKIFFLIKDSFKKLDFYFELYKGRFILKQFQNVFRGILIIQYIPKLPFRIIIGGLDHEDKLYENIILFS